MYTLIIDTNEYSGNFERAMCAYLMGKYDEYGKSYCREFIEIFDTDVATGKVPKEIVNEINENLALVQCEHDDNYFYSNVDIFPTPNRLNNGSGRHFTPKPGKEYPKAYPAYESVGIFFNESPSDAMIAYVKHRLGEFNDLRSKIDGWKVNGESKIKIVNVRVVEGR